MENTEGRPSGVEVLLALEGGREEWCGSLCVGGWLRTGLSWQDQLSRKAGGSWAAPVPQAAKDK